MPHDVNLVDRLRIERLVWSLDQRLYDLPRDPHRPPARAAHRTSARPPTTWERRRRSRTWATAARWRPSTSTAELGPGPRHSWMAAGVFLFTAELLLTSVLFDAADAFGDGILGRQPRRRRHLHVAGHRVPAERGDLHRRRRPRRVRGRRVDPAGLWVLWLAAAFLVGRLWRLPAARRRRRAYAGHAPRAS